MIPVSLRIKGLYSFQKEQTIDFTKLTQAEIFGIFGTVGSGKSTILEAISFALYCETQRMNLRDNRTYNMMNLKSNELGIEFEFSNHDEKIYRFEVRGKRHGSDFEKVNTFERKAFELINGEWIPLGAITAENIIGLSYENFRRTIIIPQGQFQEFIQLGEKDRVNMLKEIFHLEKYDFFFQTSSLENKNNDKITLLNGQLMEFVHTNPEIIAETETIVSELREALNEMRTSFEAHKKQFAEQEALKRLSDQLTEKKQLLALLTESEPKISEQEKTLLQYESCVGLFKNQLAQQKETEQSLQTQKAVSIDTSEKLNELKIQIETRQGEFEKIKIDFLNLDNKKQQLNDYNLLLAVQQLNKQITELEERIAKGDEKLQEETAKKVEIQEKITAQKTEIQEKKGKLPNLSELSEIKNWFTVQNGFRKNIETLESEKEALNQLLKIKKESFHAQLPAGLSDLRPENSIDENIEILSKLKSANQEELKKMQSEVLHLELQSKLEEFTQKLQENEACPLCGSLDHPNILSVENVIESLALNKTRIQAIQQQNELIEQANLKLNQFSTEQKGLNIQLLATLEKISNEQNASQLHTGQFGWSNYKPDNEALIDQLLASSKTENQIISGLETALAQQEKEFALADERLERYKKLLLEIQTEFQSKNTEKITISRQIKTLEVTQETLAIPDLDSKIASLSKEIASIAENHESISKLLTEKQQQQAVLKERQKTADQLIADLDKQLKKINAELEQSLKNSAFKDFEEINLILSQEIDLELLKKEITDFRQRLFKAKTDVEELEKQLEGKSFQAEEFLQLASLLKELETVLQSKHDIFNLETEKLKKFREDLLKKENLQKELEKLTLRKENITTIKNLFKGNGFINYISTAYLQNLCAAANERFYKLTRQQLRLEISDKNEFQVRDYLNEGKIRSIKTLSGGQTFQAALSLALSLAESIQQQSKARQNFFFLDEGFGSQDKNSLQIVFDSLKALREENRIIGIISHVEDLQQEIDVFLTLENDAETGSRVLPSWEKR